MCHRFTLNTNDKHELRLVYDYKLILPESKIINLGSSAYYLYKEESGSINLSQAKFGLKIFDKTIYNARCETLLEKNIFREDYISHKGVFPCSYFFEHDESKNDHKFELLKVDIGYLAGFIVNDSFILITRGAYPDLDMFKRLPIVLNESEVETYLNSKDDTHILTKFDSIKYHISGISDQIKLF